MNAKTSSKTKSYSKNSDPKMKRSSFRVRCTVRTSAMHRRAAA